MSIPQGSPFRCWVVTRLEMSLGVIAVVAPSLSYTLVGGSSRPAFLDDDQSI